jgi:chemotaxis protein MotB
MTDRRDDRDAAASSLPTDRPQPPDVTDLPEGQEGGEGSDKTGVAPGEGPASRPPAGPGMGTAETSAEARQAKAAFATDLKRAVESAMGQSDGQFSVEAVPGGLRIQLMDKEGRPMFVSGQPRLTPEALTILRTVAERLLTIPNKIALEGHTDAVATVSQELTNWELSTARASAARRFLGRQGVADDRLTMVAGYSSTQPLPLTNPTDPVNRRIAIMIWDQEARPVAPSLGGGPPPAAAPPAGGPPPAAGPRPDAPQPQAPPSRESLERELLDRTLRQAATPDASTAGPPPPPPPER